jgi:3-deoxy-D-manno-octulosonate 8-phosphate phosphatase (KDO 8-P phosphatase)
MKIPPRLRSRLAKVRLLLCDVDGILTDASIYIGGGKEMKRFNIYDGLGLVALRKEGIKVGWVSSRPSEATTDRATELKIDFLVQKKGSKVAAIEALLVQSGFSWQQVCYAGDDIVDVGALQRAGVAISVPNGVAEAKQAADYITHAAGGYGAVREIVELILKSQNKWQAIVASHAA